MRQLYRERRGAQAGMHLVAALPKRFQDVRICERAVKEGLWGMPLSACCLEEASRQGLVLGYGGTEAERIPDAVRRLRKAVRAG